MSEYNCDNLHHTATETSSTTQFQLIKLRWIVTKMTVRFEKFLGFCVEVQKLRQICKIYGQIFKNRLPIL